MTKFLSTSLLHVKCSQELTNTFSESLVPFLIMFLIGFFVVVFKFSEVEKIIDTWLMCSSHRLVVLQVVAGDLEKGILFCSYFCSTNHYNPV